VYLKNGSSHILSYSPERFLKLDKNIVLTSPIKGTIKRDANIKKDLKLKSKLLKSSKDLAENLMIVDVLRNDLSRVCKFGSVKVNKLAQLESYQNVHHLVSSIKGTLLKNKDIFDLLKATLPGGSITGAPKIRAMEIISELEKDNRGVYCGVIGYISFSGHSDFNIPIRTISIQKNQAILNSGGGIVADSIPLKEYKESLSKVSNLFPRKKKREKILCEKMIEI
jgi:para-aminobenzoate synthetase component 1